MPRRPHFARAILWAGLIFLVVLLPGQTRSRPTIEVPLRPAVAQAEAEPLSPVPKVMARQGGGASRTAAGAISSPRVGPSSLFQWLGGGFLGSLLYRLAAGYPLDDVWQDLWPPGLLDVVALMVLGSAGYGLYRRFRKKAQLNGAPPRPGFLRQKQEVSPTVSVKEEAQPGLAAIQDQDRSFDLSAFVAEVCQLVKDVYDSWNKEQLTSLNGRLKESLLEYLQMGLKIISLREEVSYLEDVTLESILITAAGINDGKEFITVLFRGRLFDYVLDRNSGKLVLGSMAYPSIFQEYWELERPLGQGSWVLRDIREG